MPKISVCVPTYKNEKTIAETLNSVNTQSYKDFEIIQREDIENKGLADNLNNIIDKTKGEILVFLAGDDILLPDALQEIITEFNNNPRLGVVSRPYYWFKDSPNIPVRKTKMKNWKIEDFFFLCGQMSGMAVKKDKLTSKFQELRFVEFASGVFPIMKMNDFAILHKPNVAIRINSSESCSSECYKQSPLKNWLKIITDNFSDNTPLLIYCRQTLATNYIGLIQIRMYGGWKRTMQEIIYMFNLEPLIMFHYKFWFYFMLVQLPASLLKLLRDLFIYKINKRLCK